MNDGMKLGIWGALSVVFFGGFLLVQGAFGSMVEAADRGGNSGAGVLLLIATAVLAILAVVAVAMFCAKLATVLGQRWDNRHANS